MIVLGDLWGWSVDYTYSYKQVLITLDLHVDGLHAGTEPCCIDLLFEDSNLDP